MPTILNEYIDGDLKVTEYTQDGETVSHRVEVIADYTDIPVPEPKPTLEEVADATLLETQYQTVLIEMLAGF